MNLLLHRSLTIDRNGLERIMQTVLFYADTVTIRAAAVAPGGDQRIRRRMNELIDLGALQTWAHEYELGQGGVVRTGRDAAIASTVPRYVLTLEETRELVRGVDSDLTRHHNEVSPSPGATLHEGISEIVQFRHALGALRLTDSLGADGVILGSRGKPPMIGSIQRTTTPVDVKEAVVREVVGLCRFGPLSDLPIQAVADCRREMPPFRALLQQTVSDAPSSGGMSGSPRELAELILSEYRTVARSRRRRPERAGSVWDVVGAVLPSAVAVRLIGARIEWFRYRNRSRPFVLLGKLAHHHDG